MRRERARAADARAALPLAVFGLPVPPHDAAVEDAAAAEDEARAEVVAVAAAVVVVALVKEPDGKA